MSEYNCVITGGDCAEAERGEPRAAYRGVTRLEKERKWVARVWVDSKQKTVGRYDSDIAAAQVWCLLCPRYLGLQS